MGSPVQGQAPAHLRPVSTWGMRHRASLLWRELQVRSQPPSLFHAQASKRFLHLTPFQYAHGCSPLFLPLTSSIHHIQMPCGSALPPQPRRTGSPRCNPPALPSCSKSAVSRVIRKDIIVGKCFFGRLLSQQHHSPHASWHQPGCIPGPAWSRLRPGSLLSRV